MDVWYKDSVIAIRKRTDGFALPILLRLYGLFWLLARGRTRLFPDGFNDVCDEDYVRRDNSCDRSVYGVA